MILDGSFEADLLKIDASSLTMRNNIRGVNLYFQGILYFCMWDGGLTDTLVGSSLLFRSMPYIYCATSNNSA